MAQRRDFVEDYLPGLYPLSDLCAHDGIGCRLGRTPVTAPDRGRPPGASR